MGEAAVERGQTETPTNMRIARVTHISQPSFRLIMNLTLSSFQLNMPNCAITDFDARVDDARIFAKFPRGSGAQYNGGTDSPLKQVKSLSGSVSLFSYREENL